MPKPLLLGLVVLAGCEPSPVDPGGGAGVPVIVSNAVFAGAAASAGEQVAIGAAGGAAYVSLPPDAVPLGTRATIVNRATGQSAVVPMANGGFDPVAVPASDGQVLDITIEQSGAAALVLSEAVRAARRPVVVRTDPPPRRRDVPLNAAIIVVFSEPVDSASLGSGAVRVRGTAPVAGTLSFGDSLHLTAVFVPAAPLAAGATYRLEVADVVTDLDGEPLESPVTVEFTTVVGSGTQSRIAFTSTVDTYMHTVIAAVNADGTSRRDLVNIGDWQGGLAWSPEGDRLAFARQPWGEGTVSIFTMNADGSGIVRVTSRSSAWPTWSPDGRRIAFTSVPAAGSGVPAKVFVANADGSAATQLTSGPEDDLEPAWSPDGARIAFERKPANSMRSQICFTNADGTGLRCLTDGQAYAKSPAWSPDARQIAFAAAPVVGDSVGNLDVYVMGADGSGLTRLTSDPGQDDTPSWSPDGTRIAFASARARPRGYMQIFIMNADGSNVTALTNEPLGAYDPDWSRTGLVPPPPELTVQMAPTASGDGQTDTVRATLADPLRVLVLRGSAPAAGVAVTWWVPAEGGSVADTTAITDAQGIAAVRRTLGSSATIRSGNNGENEPLSRTLASVAGASGSPVIFSATALPGQPMSIRGTAHETVGAVNAPVEVVGVIPEDAYGNWVSGVRVVWNAAAGGGSVRPLSQGAYDVRLILGPDEGVHTFAASAPELPGSQVVTFSYTVVGALVRISSYWDTPRDSGFVPAELTVQSGTLVGWTNEDLMSSHDVTFEDDPTRPVSSGLLLGWDFYEGPKVFHVRRFTGIPRIIRYRCTLHSTDFATGEVGTVTVR